MVESKDILAVILSYAIGCVSTGYYLTRLWTGTDIRKFGSRSTGARNVARLLGWTGFVLTFSGDFAKGPIAMWVATTLTNQTWVITASLLAVVTGHIWPAQLGFKGGKGIAVALGGILFFDYRLLIACLLVFCLCLVFMRKYTLSGLIAAALTPVGAILAGHSAIDCAGIIALGIVILISHRKNMTDLFRKKYVDGREIKQQPNARQ